jgi:hypothetical protein
LTFYSAWPDSVTVGSYEIHTRTARSRKLEALNSAIRVLNLSWFRSFQDEVTVTTATNQWRYALPNSVNGWTGIVDVQVQMAPSLAGYPYQDASNWNVQPYRAVDASVATRPGISSSGSCRRPVASSVSAAPRATRTW